MAISSYDRMSELKAFDDTKTGVKGLVDSGITKEIVDKVRDASETWGFF
ncbi:hypothetical protein RDI58_023195 [Solanum bulbocastanum]|uniref:Uncharacterized protein n=1 Tax=Solanum bulbocastanum TaxID=147425 RepID=A0AAN8TC50_SOLBU